MDLTSKNIIKEDASEDDQLTKEWTEKMTDAVIEQTWSIALRKVADVTVCVSLALILIIIFTSILVSSKAGCITAVIAFLTLSIITEFIARISNRKNKDAVLRAAIETTNYPKI